MPEETYDTQIDVETDPKSDTAMARPELDFDPGEIAPCWASPYPDAELEDEEQKALKRLADMIGEIDITARRFEIEQGWQLRLYDRGYQYLLPRRGGGWIYVPFQTSSQYGRSGQAFFGNETNIIATYGEIISAALTRDVPRVRFEPQNPSSDADITAKDAATDYARIFSRTNDLQDLQQQLAYYLRVDGRALIVTDHIIDAQQFGRCEAEPEQPLVPETEGDGPKPYIYAVSEGITAPEGEEDSEGIDQKGERQIEHAADWLKDKGIQAVYSAPSDSAMASAQIIAEKLGVQVEVDDRLASIELPDKGMDGERVSHEEIERLVAENPEFQQTVQSAVMDLLSAEGKPVAIVVDDAVISQIFKMFQGDDVPPTAVVDPGWIATVTPDNDGMTFKPQVAYPFNPPESATGQKRGKPRGQEVAKVYGKLEHRVPFAASSGLLSDCQWVQVAGEYDETLPKAMFPEKADKIKASGTSPGENQIDRTARINSTLALEAGYLTGDSMIRDCTVTRTWFRPSFFMAIENKRVREAIFQKFPDGALVIQAGEEFIKARNENMDDHLTLVHATQGSGMNRQALCSKILSVNKRLNTWLDLLDQYFVKCVPMRYMAQGPFDVTAINDQGTVVGGYTPFLLDNVPQNRSVTDLIWQEPYPTPNPVMSDFIKFFITELPQLLSHALPSLFGAAANLMDVNEWIPTTSGFKFNGDLQDGDTIFGQDGKPYMIDIAHPAREEESFLVSFDDGTFVLVHSGHLWKTFTDCERQSAYKKTPEYRRKRRMSRRSTAKTRNIGPPHENDRDSVIISAPDGAIRTTQEILESVRTQDGRINHAIRVASPIELPEKELVLDPYVLGVWLGDGSSGSGRLTAADDDGLIISDEIKKCGYDCYKTASMQTYNICGITDKLRRVGVLNSKHIPYDYQWSSTSQRLSLLQGLMDTDGCAMKQGNVKFTNTNRSLAEGVYQLAASLGIKPFISSYISEGKWINANKKTEPYWTPGGIETWNVSWTSDVPVFRLPRKLSRIKKGKKSQWRYITSIEPKGPRMMRCLTTSNPTGLYLYGKTFNVTHNTDTASGIAIQRDQALGCLGSPWHSINVATANYFRQAVQLAAQCRPAYGDSSIQGMVDGKVVTVDLTQLKGNVMAYPDSDANFPESWVQRQSRWTQMIQEANNPLFQKLMESIKNRMAAIDAIGLEGLSDPDKPSWEKQQGEFEILLKTPPVPNPEYQQAQQAIQEAAQQIQGEQAAGSAATPEQLQAIQQMEQSLQSIAPMVSSYPVKDSDDHAVEAECCLEKIRSADGRKMADGDPRQRASFQNLVLHWTEHDSKIPKPPDAIKDLPKGFSAAIDKLPPDAAANLLTSVGAETKGPEVVQNREFTAELRKSSRVTGPPVPGMGT